jgi:hypothetical protein
LRSSGVGRVTGAPELFRLHRSAAAVKEWLDVR